MLDCIILYVGYRKTRWQSDRFHKNADKQNTLHIGWFFFMNTLSSGITYDKVILTELWDFLSPNFLWQIKAVFQYNDWSLGYLDILILSSYWKDLNNSDFLPRSWQLFSTVADLLHLTVWQLPSLYKSNMSLQRVVHVVVDYKHHCHEEFLKASLSRQQSKSLLEISLKLRWGFGLSTAPSIKN